MKREPDGHVREKALAEHPEADQASHNQVDGNEVIEKTRKYEDEDPHDKGDDRRKMGIDGHGHDPGLLEEVVVPCAASRLPPAYASDTRSPDTLQVVLCTW
jgi:hypothetical protein